MEILIVGAGLYGSVCAYELTKAGHTCHVIDKRDHVGGNIFTRFSEEAQCHEHVYGAHIFHTNSRMIWDYINQFANFNTFTHRVKVKHGERIYSFPINILTLYQVYGAQTPDEAKRCLQADIIPYDNPSNMEEFCLSTIGRRLYSIFIEGYSQKQWGKHPRELPADIIKRIPYRFNFDDHYFDDKYQGIPVGGYTAIIEQMLQGVSTQLNTCFFANKDRYLDQHDQVIYTGPIDQYFDYKFGVLEYRSLRFERELLPVGDWQGNAVINYSGAEVPWTRIIEHKHFDMHMKGSHTLITREFPEAWAPDKIPYYPINDQRNNDLYGMYRNEAKKNEKVSFGGRLGSYRYYDMHQVIGAALAFCTKFGNS